ncbi:MAG: phosphoenolpyruvate carboxykinase (GTP) [Planctomycetota bacterium]|jgi:phosphoenolpyruvate carboxykinase (GTP)|nr:phosphoenolpyruvate carboxykinase (GTP) [Planctomycetota bacterium]
MAGKTEHAVMQGWVKEMADMCKPDNVYWCDGSEGEAKKLTAEALASGELIELNSKLLPGCVYHRTALNDVARTENLTFICTDKKDDATPINNWKSRQDGYAEARSFFDGSMKGRTLYVVPFSMGPVGSPFAKYGIELTDSIYVVLNMRVMAHMGQPILDVLGTNGEFTKCLHSKAQLDIEKRRILHFPEDNTIWSVNSGYGGNVLLGKKCLALRIASWLGKKEGWMAEHMLILGVEYPDGKTEYIAAAFPSACGKTNLAMLVPPDGLKAKGYKVWTVGDDIAWLRIGKDGRLWAVNPEAGCFGVAPGTGLKTNPNMMKAVQKNTIFTNVLLRDDKTVWWEGHDAPAPENATDWTGKPWKPGQKDENGKNIPGANPNSRFTVPIKQVPCVSKEVDNPEGVPISAFIFGGRRARLAPLVYESFNWQHGTYVAATMASERTAAQYGKQGEVRRDPMAMSPFVGYAMGDYFRHWLDMGRKIPNPPRIYHVNWFRQDDNGKFIWPGFGDNLRVLEWVLRRRSGQVEAIETPIGNMPRPENLDLTGLDLPAGVIEKLLSIDKGEWKTECDGVEEYFKSLGPRVPQELYDELAALRKRLAK